MYRRVLALVISLLVASAASAGEIGSRPEYFDRSLPYPVYVPHRFGWPVNWTYSDEMIFRVQLRVDENGKVDSLVLPEAFSDQARPYVERLSDSLRFEPGLIGGKAAPMWIYAGLHVFGRSWLPKLTMPVDSLGTVTDVSLYFQSFSLNGVNLPELVDFPRFGCYFEPDDSIFSIPTSIIAVDLDRAGHVVERTMLRSSSVLPDNQILSAILWAKFKPLEVDGAARPSRIYITASCFPLSSQPSDPFPETRDSLRSFFREYQVKLRYDTLGLLLPAIPRKTHPTRMVIRARGAGSHDVFSLGIRVDTLGKAYASIGSDPDSYRRNVVKAILKDLKFHPAIDWHGQAVPFSGLIRVDPSAEPTIRIEYFW